MNCKAFLVDNRMGNVPRRRLHKSLGCSHFIIARRNQSNIFKKIDRGLLKNNFLIDRQKQHAFSGAADFRELKWLRNDEDIIAFSFEDAQFQDEDFQSVYYVANSLIQGEKHLM